MITKADLKIEAARLAMDAVNDSRGKGQEVISFTLLAEEIYDFLVKDIELKDFDDPEGTMKNIAALMTGNSLWSTSTNNVPNTNEDGQEEKREAETEKF